MFARKYAIYGAVLVGQLWLGIGFSSIWLPPLPISAGIQIGLFVLMTGLALVLMFGAFGRDCTSGERLGSYHYTRHPYWCASMLLTTAWGVLLQALLTPLLVILTGWALTLLVLRPSEQLKMHEPAYVRYCQSVGCWW
ncbi:hypothetical protein AB6D11_00730 [Vibrio splendidus]